MAITPHALVRDGVVVEFRDADAEMVPQHKRDVDGGLLVRPFIDEGEPDYNPALEELTSDLIITPEAVTKTYDVIRKDITLQKLAVKNEARRRILLNYPEWMQANMTARAVELQDIFRQNDEWTVEEQAEQTALLAAWAWIKGVRMFSNTIENMDPIPSDFTDDSYWTNG